MIDVSDSELYLIPIEYRGGTTMGTLSRLIDYPISSYILVTDEDRLFFEDLLSKTKKRKHYQQKLVYDYSLMYKDSSNTNHYLVVTDYKIIDLSNRKEYCVKDESQQQDLLEFVARLQQISENIVVQPDTLKNGRRGIVVYRDGRVVYSDIQQ